MHGVPAVDSWQALFKTQNIVRTLPQNEFDEANRVINGGELSERFNVTIRWHESHYDRCPYLCGTAAQIAVPQAPARTMHVDLDDLDAPCLPGSAPVRKMPETAAVNNIVGPVAPPPPPEEAVYTHCVDPEQATVAKAALFRLFADVTFAVPAWTDHCAALSLLPSRAAQNHDYEVLK